MKLNHSRILIVGIAGVLAAIGSRLAGAEVRVDPSTLLTQSQVTAAFGEDFGAGQEINATACAWTAANAKMKMTVSLWEISGFDKLKTPMVGVTKTPVAGLGDDAFYAKIGQFVVLNVKKGDVIFIVKIYGLNDPDRQMAVEKSLALDIVAKL